MCTPWIRDWATCFFACRFPLDEEPETFCSSTVQVPRGSTMVFNHNNNNSHEMKKMGSRNTKRNQEKETGPSSKQAKETDRDSSWPHFADEDYIVFCFREDGAIHVVRDGKKPEASDYLLKNEDERDVYLTNEKGKGKWRINSDMALPAGQFRGENCIEETKECKMESSAESRDSNQSDASSSSFAFPVLSLEGVGSPVKMPKPDALQLRKHKKALAARLHCCRF